MQKSTVNPKSAMKQSTNPGSSRVAFKSQKTTNVTKKPAVPEAKQQQSKPQTAMAKVAKSTPPVPSGPGTGAFEIMASRIANRVAEMAENITFSERPQTKAQSDTSEIQTSSKRPPRKLEMRLQQQSADSIKFSAPFLDNTLAKMLDLQNRMLRTGSQIAASDASDEVKREQFQQSAELSKIIALICAEKARQGA